MKINDIGRVGAVKAYQQTTKIKNDSKAEAKKDELQISKAGQELLKAQRSDILNPAQRNGKIESIKEQVETGTYQIDSKAVAEKLSRAHPWLLEK